MEKENQRKNKITPFPSPEERKKHKKWKENFKRQLRKEADEWETELENKPGFEDIDASPELFDRIIKKLKEEGKWEEETAEELAPDIRHLLSDKDWEALESGRREQRRGKKKSVKKWFGVAAAVVFCMSIAALSSEANRQYAAGVINAITGSKWGIYIEDAGRAAVKSSEDEWKAFADIEEQLGIPAPQMQYRPSGMEFKSYEVNADKKSGAIFYQYEEKLVITYLYARMKEVTIQQTYNARLIDEIEMEGMEIPVNLYELEQDGENYYAGEILYKNGYYVILGKMDKSEFIKMLENAGF